MKTVDQQLTLGEVYVAFAARITVIALAAKFSAIVKPMSNQSPLRIEVL